MNAKAKGSRNERRTIKLLEKYGYSCTKSGGSLGAWDIVGIGRASVVLVQVKTNRKPRRQEIEAMKRFITPPLSVGKFVVVWHDGSKIPEWWKVPYYALPDTKLLLVGAGSISLQDTMNRVC